MAKGRAARAGLTRRAVLVIGGVTLIVGYSEGPARQIADAARTGAGAPDACSRTRPDAGCQSYGRTTPPC